MIASVLWITLTLLVTLSNYYWNGARVESGGIVLLPCARTVQTLDGEIIHGCKGRAKYLLSGESGLQFLKLWIIPRLEQVHLVGFLCLGVRTSYKIRNWAASRCAGNTVHGWCVYMVAQVCTEGFEKGSSYIFRCARPGNEGILMVMILLHPHPVWLHCIQYFSNPSHVQDHVEGYVRSCALT